MKRTAQEKYERLLKHYNRQHSPEKTCFCGKIVTENTYDSHLRTKSHKFLLHYKQMAQEEEKKQEETEEEKKKNITTWDKITKNENKNSVIVRNDNE